MYEQIAYTLFVFWVCGSLSVLVDFDHIWTVLKRISPIRLSESYGRPLHTRAVFLVVACVVCLGVVTFGDGFYRAILQEFGEGGGIIFFLILITITYVLSKYIGDYLFNRMVRTRWNWKHNKEKPKNVG